MSDTYYFHELQRRLDLAVEALEYYVDKETIVVPEGFRVQDFELYPLESEDIGQVARAALEEINKPR